jgi:hypothetical protein
MISSLTEEKKALIPIYLQKWHLVIHSSHGINQDQVTNAIRVAYRLIHRKEPEIQFYPSPYTALLAFAPLEDAYCFFDTEIAGELEQKITAFFTKEINKQIENNLRIFLWQNLSFSWYFNIWNKLWDELKRRETLGEIGLLGEDWSLNAEPSGDLDGMRWASFAPYFDFCFSVLKCSDGQAKLDGIELSFSGKKSSLPSRWNIFQDIAKNCGWFFPLDGLCLVSEKPKIYYDASKSNFSPDCDFKMIFPDGFTIES